jgi:hypothetical protein
MGDDGLDEEEDGFGCEIGTLENFKKAKVCMINLIDDEFAHN